MKRLLFISHRIPYPPNKGDKIRAYHLLNYLSKEYSIDLVTFTESKSDLSYEDHLSEFCNSIKVFRINKIQSLFKALIALLFGKSLSNGYYYLTKAFRYTKKKIRENEYDILFAYSSQTAQYISGYAEKKVMDFVDVDSQKWKQYSLEKKFPLSLIYKAEAKRLAKFERQIANSFYLTIFSTQKELELFKNIGGEGNLFVMNNGVDYNYFKPQNFKKENAIVFVGAMDYFPNIDGIIWFVKEVFPKILGTFPQIKLYIVGSNPVNDIIRLKSESIVVTGFVNDVRPYMEKAKFAVIPLRIARGIQNKILEAMSMMLPVVINEELAISLDKINREHLLIYKNADDFASIIINKLLQDADLQHMGKILRQEIIKHYSWERKVSELNSQFVK